MKVDFIPRSLDRLRSTARHFNPLRRATKIPIWADLGGRLGLLLFLIGTVILIHWFGRDGLHDSKDGHMSFLDVVYFTMISITTTGFGDITPVSDSARLMEAVIVTPIRLAVLFIFVGTAYSFAIKRSWEKWRMARIQKQLSNHIVILGFGTSGSEAARELRERGIPPQSIVVVDPSPTRIAEAEESGFNVLQGDATRDELLTDIRVGDAQAILVSAGRDDSSILIVLTARHLAPNIPISVVIRNADNELLARQAGADTVINPISFTGFLLAGSAQGAHTADYIADLATISGAVHLNERPVAPEEIGQSIDHLSGRARGLRIYRNGTPFGFWEPEAQKLELGDLVVEVLPTVDHE